MAIETIAEFAPAKINLCLHVTGRRADGYHLLDSIVAFAGVGDHIRVAPGAGFELTGPMAADLTGEGDNLCLRAARAMGGAVHIALEKHLPVASGIGGGSADAAATLRAMARMGRDLPTEAEVLALGADVPVCLAGRPLRMEGVGEVLTPISLPEAYLVLVNPRVGVSTPVVFKALAVKDNPAIDAVPHFACAQDLALWLAGQRNDLEAPAIALLPVIAEVKQAIAATRDVLLARMSGSGATCFGLYATKEKATVAAALLKDHHPDWWVAAAELLP